MVGCVKRQSKNYYEHTHGLQNNIQSQKQKKKKRERDNAKNSSKTETNANDERNDMITTDVLYT